MDFKSINNKKVQDGRLRITEPTIIFTDQTGYIAEHVVTKSENGRIDLISDKYYQDVDYAEYILKYNKISNPFSIVEGDVLLIPDIDSPLVKWNGVKVNEYESNQVDSIRSQFMDTKRLSTKDAKRVEYLKKKASNLKNGSKEMLPPNILKPGEENIDITDNSITI